MGNGTKTPPGKIGFGTPPLAESKPFLLSTIFKRLSKKLASLSQSIA
jgi:hypothetical protein